MFEKIFNRMCACSALFLLAFVFIIGARAQQSGAGKNLRFLPGGGNTGSIVAIPDSASLDITNAITLEAWVRRSDAVLGRNRIFTKAPEIYTLRFGTDCCDQDVQFILNPVGGGLAWARGEDVSAFANKWIHIAATWNGSGDRLPRIYINGRESSYITQTMVNPPLETSTSEVWLSLWAETFNGDIDQARIWNVARTPNQIIQWMHKTENLTSEPGLVSVWNMNEGTGSTTADLLGLNNGTLYSCDRFGMPGCTNNSNAPQWQNSTAPFGVKGAFVEATGIPTSAGPAGGTITANITSAANMSNNLGLYQFGSATGGFVTGSVFENFPFGISTRSNILWGAFERGTVVANLVFDYSQVTGITDPSTVKLLRRTDANDTTWEVAPVTSRDDMARTFTLNGAADYYEYSLGIPTSVPCAPVPVDIVSWWKLETDATDARAGNDGILTNVTFTGGAIGQAANFHGMAYITVFDNPSLDFTANQDFTIEAYVKTSSPNAVLSIVDKRLLSDPNFGYAFYLSNGVPTLGLASGTAINYSAGGASIADGNWHHLIVSVDRANPSGGIRFFVDGLQRGAAQVALDGDLSNTANFFIGEHIFGIHGRFVGQIDEVGIYNRALSAAEVQSIYHSHQIGKCHPTATNPPANLIGWWAGDGNAEDDSTNANHGTPLGAGFKVGKSGQAFSLEGAGYINIPHNAVYDSITTGFSVETWIKVNSFMGDDDTIISKGTDSWRLQRRPGTNFLRFGTTQSGGVTNDLESNVNVNDGTWHHVVATFSNGVKHIWIDGALDNGLTHIAAPLQTNAADIRIGDNSAAPGRFFNGLIDETTIYARALTDNEIRALYRAGLAGKLKEADTPVGFSAVKNPFSSAIPQSTTVTIGDATITFASVTTAGVTQLVPLDPSQQLPLPLGHAHTGLVYDISTTAVYSGNINTCFNLQAFANLSSTEFNGRNVMHLEGGAWVDRTFSRDFATKIICARTTSLSPFAIVDTLAPTSASVSVGGRVLVDENRGLGRAMVTLTGTNGELRTALTNSFGYYRFDEIPVGETYFLSVSSKRYQFAPQMVFLTEEIAEMNFMALP